MRTLKLAGLVTCSMALAATNALAEPRQLGDNELDGVTAGQPSLGSSFLFGNGTVDTEVSDFTQFLAGLLRPRPAATIAEFELDSDSDSVSSSDGSGGSALAQTDPARRDAFLANPEKFVRDEFGYVPRGFLFR
jgi:hypothetical protein